MFFKNLEARMAVKEAQPLNQVVILIYELLSFEELEVLKFFFSLHENSSVILG